MIWVVAKIPDTQAPFVVAALVSRVRCTACGQVTDDVTTNRRSRTPSWPCRPCRRRIERERSKQGRPVPCSASRCKAFARYPARFCDGHAPRFSR